LRPPLFLARFFFLSKSKLEWIIRLCFSQLPADQLQVNTGILHMITPSRRQSHCTQLATGLNGT
jgi:hypothetical protein